MRNVRKAYMIYVDVNPKDMSSLNPNISTFNAVRSIINSTSSYYNPNISVASESDQPDPMEGRFRKAFLLYINLDDKPGMMHSQESVQNVIRNLLYQRLPHYNATVSLASSDFQHTTETEGSTTA